MVSTSLMVDTIPVPPRPILLCALNCALTEIRHFQSGGSAVDGVRDCGGIRHRLPQGALNAHVERAVQSSMAPLPFAHNAQGTPRDRLPATVRNIGARSARFAWNRILMPPDQAFRSN